MARTKPLSMAATAGVIWLCACVRYWLYRGVGSVCCIPYFVIVRFNHTGMTDQAKDSLVSFNLFVKTVVALGAGVFRCLVCVYSDR